MTIRPPFFLLINMLFSMIAGYRLWFKWKIFTWRFDTYEICSTIKGILLAVNYSCTLYWVLLSSGMISWCSQAPIK